MSDLSLIYTVLGKMFRLRASCCAGNWPFISLSYTETRFYMQTAIKLPQEFQVVEFSTHNDGCIMWSYTHGQ